MKSFNVVCEDFNRRKIVPYDVIPYFVGAYNEAEEKPVTFDEFKQFVKNESMYMFWSRCEYEVIICGWPNEDMKEKWDIHRQIMMNLDTVTSLVMESI